MDRRTVPPRRLVAAALALVALATVAACGGAPEDGGTEDGAGDPSGAREVVLVTYDAFVLPEQAAAEFEERTGAAITVLNSGDTGTMLSKALLSAGAPEGDVIFGIDNTIAAEVQGADLLARFVAGATESLDPALRLPGELDGVLTPIDSGDVCVNFDQQWFAEAGLDPPDSLDDLTSPEYADLLVVQDPLNSSPGLAFLLGTVEQYGDDGFEAYWTALADNGVRVSPSWDDAWYNDYTVSGGDRPIVVSYATSPPAEVVFSEGTVTEPRSAVMVDGCVAQVEYAGVLEGAANPELAEELVEFMLGEQWQSEIPLTNFVRPVVDVELPEEFVEWAPVPRNPIPIDPVVVAENRDDWLERWRAVMQ